MHLMTNSTPMTVANQHWVLCPEASSASQLTDPSTVWNAQAVYAPSPEAAVEMIRDLYRMGDYGEPITPDGLDKIRLAQGEELPWNDPKVSVSVVMPKDGGERVVFDMDHETILFCYGPEASIRRASAEEAEPIIRENTCSRDQEDEEQFNYGFNVLYKMEQEERAIAEMGE